MNFYELDLLIGRLRSARTLANQGAILAELQDFVLVLDVPMKWILIYQDPEEPDCWYVRHSQETWDVWFCVGGPDNPCVGYSYHTNTATPVTRERIYRWLNFVRTAVRVQPQVDSTLRRLLWEEPRLEALLRSL